MTADRYFKNAAARRPTLAVAVGLACWLMVAQAPVGAQPAKAPTAVKLPDGTIVVYTKSPDDPNPPIDGVVLTPLEYKAFLDQAEQLKKLKDAPKFQLPSGCAIQAKVVQRGDRAVALLTLTFQVRTTAPRTPVPLGCQKAFPVSAKYADGRLPVLLAADDGLTVLPDAAGDHALTVELEAPIASRGAKGELGFEIGLPRAAITTLTWEPQPGVKKVLVGVRTAADKPGEIRVSTEDAGKLTRHPLGPVELLQLIWEPPSAPAPPVEVVNSAEAEVAVRIEDSQIETTATLRLRGTPKEWTFTVPVGSEVTVDRPAVPKEPVGDPPSAGLAKALIRPVDPNKPVWTFRPPEGSGGEWVVLAVTKFTRPKPADGKFKGPYAVGPYAVSTVVRMTGTIKVFAPPTTRVTFPNPPADVRRQDAPAADDDLVALFRIATATANKQQPAPLLTFEARPAPGFVRVHPTYSLKRTETGWRLDLEARVTPVRTEVDQLLVDVPAGWQAVEAAPTELVEVQVPEGTNPMAARTLTVRLTAPQKAPFDLVLSAVFPVPLGVRETSLPLPRFPGIQEQQAKVAASVPDGFEVRGTAVGSEPGQPSSSQELRVQPGTKPTSAVTHVVAQFEKSAVRVDLSWQPHRPELNAESRAEIAIQDRQATIVQTIRFRAGEGDVKPVRLVGPVGLTGLRGPLEPVRPGEWAFRPAADGPKEFAITFTYAVPIPPRKPEAGGPLRFPVGLFWPETATKVETTVHVWGGGSTRRATRFDGPWRELAPEPSADREALPWLTAVGSGTGLPLTLELADPAESGIPTTTVDRALLQAWVGDDGAVAIRARFVLRRWSPGGIEVELPTGINSEFKIDDRRIDPISVASGEAADGRTVRVPVPERLGKTTMLLEVRYVTPPGRTVELALVPPKLSAAIYRTPARWQVIVSSDAVPLSVGRDVQPDTRWTWHGGSFAPGAGSTTRELEQWLAGSAEAPPDSEEPPGSSAMTARQAVLGPVALVPVRRGWWIAVCSLVALVVGYGLARLRPGLLGPALALVGVGIAVPAAGWPQLAAQAVAASVPGLLGLVGVLGVLALIRWVYRRRIARLPGFTRIRPDSVLAKSSTAGSRLPTMSGSAVVLEASGSQPTLTTPSGS